VDTSAEIEGVLARFQCGLNVKGRERKGGPKSREGVKAVAAEETEKLVPTNGNLGFKVRGGTNKKQQNTKNNEKQTTTQSNFKKKKKKKKEGGGV